MMGVLRLVLVWCLVDLSIIQSEGQISGSLGLDYGDLDAALAAQRGQGQPSAKPSQNRTELLQKYSLEQKARLAIIREKSRLYTEWDIRHFPLFLETFHIPTRSWKIYKAKFIDLLIKTQGKNTSKFVIGFSGSSVTAGHDNYIYEAYPAIVEKTLRNIFSPLGIELEVRNHAMGNNPCYPYDTCMSTHLGDDVDIITWEQSMNCGRNPKPVESFLRSVARMPKKPMVIFITSGTPYWKPAECSSSPALRGTGSNSTLPLTTREMELLRLPLAVVANTSSYVLEKLPFFNAAENLLDHYETSVAPSVQSVNDVVNTYKCMGPYGPTFGMKTKGEGKGWHPGVLGHKYRADSLSYFMMEIFKESLDDYITASMEGEKTLHELHQTNSQILSSHHSSRLPKPIACEEIVCGKTPQCYTNYEPKMKNNLTDIIVSTRRSNEPALPKNWMFEISWFDQTGVKKAIEEKRGYLDKKYIIRSNFTGEGALTTIDSDSILTVHINPTQKGPIWLCQVQKGFLKYPPSDGELDQAAALSIHTNIPLPVNLLAPFVDGLKGTSLNLTRIEDECFQTPPIEKGNHFISIWPKNKKIQINLAYVLYW